MADNLTTQTATLATIAGGSVIATDDIGGVHYQKIVLRKGTKTVAAVTCDTSADTLLAANTERLEATLQNVGSVDAYVGPSGVTTSTGLLLSAGSIMTDDKSTDAWVGVTASGTANIRVCEVS